MAQLTTTYQQIAQTYLGNTGYGDVYVRLYMKYNSQSIPNNTSSVSYKSTLYITNGSFTTGTTTTKTLSGTGATTASGNGAGTYSAGETTLYEITGTVTHSADGTGSASGSATFYSSPWGWNGTASGTATLPTIPRYTSITSFTVAKRNETSFTFSWATANTVDYVWYSTNNGSSWTGYDVTDGTSGSFVVSSLSPNTTYNCKIRVRRKDSQLTTDSGTVSQSTYKVPTQSLSSKTETSVTMNWSIDSTADYIWYSTNNGGNWTAVGSVNATSGSYTISGLSANTSYNIKTRVRRKASQTTYDTSTLAQTTYNYPYITKVTTQNLVIGQSQIINLYNPLKRNVTIKMYKNSYGSTELYSGTTTGTTFSFTPTASTLYASIPNNTTAKCVYSAIYGSVVRTTSQYDYSINVNQCKPTFSNFAYSTNLSNLTGNNDTIINGVTTTTITISSANKAVAKNSATISKYVVQIGSMPTVNVAYSSSSSVSANITNCNSVIVRVTAVDSRNLETTVTKQITTYKDYFAPSFSLTNAERQDGIEADSFMDLGINFWNKSFGSKQNTIREIRYRVKTSNSSTWSDWTLDAFKIDLSQLVINNNEAKLENYPIYVDGVSTDFTVGTSYDVQVKLIDGSSDYALNEVISSIFTLADGKVAFSIFKDNNGEYHIGINGMPSASYTLKVHGTINNS